jgi:hypothetical protein
VAFVSVEPHRAERGKTLDARIGCLSEASRRASLDRGAWEERTKLAGFFLWLGWEYLMLSELRRVDGHYKTLQHESERYAFAIVNADELVRITRTLASVLDDPSAKTFFTRVKKEFKFLECSMWTLLPAPPQ